MIKKLFQTTFNIREGEFKIALLMQLYIFIVITVLLLVKPTINALFLSHLGAEELPNAFLLVAATAIFTSYFYDRSLRKFEIKNIVIVSLLFFSICFILLGYYFSTIINSDFILYAYYLSVSIFGVLITSQFWIIANMVFNAREAKRLFGLIGAGAIAGGIFGGYLTTLISQAFGSSYVMLLAGLLIICCIPIVIWVAKHRDSTVFNRQIVGKEIQVGKSAFKLVLESKHLTYLALIVGVSVIMAKLVDYQFSDFAHIKITDPDELAAFFGFWFSTFNVLSLGIQLFLTNRLLAWLGVTSNLLILPLGIALGCLLFLIFPELWVLIILKGMDGSFKQSINKAAVELSIMPIPYEDKKQAKSFIDVVVDSIATGIAGFLLIFVVKQLDLHSHYITIMILFFLFVWIILIYQLRGAYFDSFKNNILKAIGNHDLDVIKKTKKPLHSSVIKILTKGSEKEIITLLDNLGDTVIDIHKPYIIKLLDHPSNEVKAAAIKEIYFFKHGEAAQKIKHLVENNNDREVVYEAMEYLLLHTNVNEDELFEDYLNHSKNHIADAALLCLAQLAMDNKYLVNKYDLYGRMETKMHEINDPSIDHTQEELAEFLVATGYAGYPKFFDFIKEHLSNENHYLLKHAIKAAGFSQHKNFIGTLIRHLDKDDLRAEVIFALQNFGNEIPHYILDHDVHEHLDNSIRKHFPKVIASIRSKDSLKVLMRLSISSDSFIRLQAAKTMVDLHFREAGIKLDNDKIIKAVLNECDFYIQRLLAIKALSITPTSNPFEDDTELQIKREQLINLLQRDLHYSMNVIFEVLALVLNENDMEIAYFGLKDESESVKMNAIEFLDNILLVGLKAELMPLLEHHFIRERELSELSDSSFNIDDETTCLIKLLKDGTVEIKSAALDVVAQLKNRSLYTETLSQLASHKDTTIARKAIKMIKASA